MRLRAAPSAGALYAAEIYVLAERVDGLPAGVYAYSPMENALIELRRGSALPRAAAALELPERADGAAMALVVTNARPAYGEVVEFVGIEFGERHRLNRSPEEIDRGCRGFARIVPPLVRNDERGLMQIGADM